MNGSAYCRRHGCNTRKVERMDRLGRLAWVCLPCQRNAKGLCRDCPTPLASPRALRCEGCRAARERQRRNARSKESYWRRRDRVLAQKRDYSQRPGVRTHRLAYLADYRATHAIERDDQLRAYHRTWMRERRKDQAWRDRINARRREIARMKRAGMWEAVA